MTSFDGDFWNKTTQQSNNDIAANPSLGLANEQLVVVGDYLHLLEQNKEKDPCSVNGADTLHLTRQIAHWLFQ